MSGLTRMPAKKTSLLDRLRAGDVINPTVVLPSDNVPAPVVFGSPSLLALKQVSPAVSPAVVTVMVGAATVAEEVEDLIQRFVGKGTNLGDLMGNPTKVLFEIISNVGDYGKAIGDLQGLFAASMKVFGSFRPALSEFLAYSQAQRSQAYALFRRELDLDNDVTEETIERYVVIGFQVLAYGDDFVRVLIPQILGLFNRSK